MKTTAKALIAAVVIFGTTGCYSIYTDPNAINGPLFQPELPMQPTPTPTPTPSPHHNVVWPF